MPTTSTGPQTGSSPVQDLPRQSSVDAAQGWQGDGDVLAEQVADEQEAAAGVLAGGYVQPGFQRCLRRCIEAQGEAACLQLEYGSGGGLRQGRRERARSAGGVGLDAAWRDVTAPSAAAPKPTA